MKNVCVTGGNGFIAKNLIERLKKEKSVQSILIIYKRNNEGYSPFCQTDNNSSPTITYLHGDINSLGKNNFLGSLLQSHSVDTIFHLAAKSTNNYSEQEIFESNVLATHTLLQNSPKDCRFIFASSSTVYGDLTADAGRCDEWDETFPTSFYGLSKKMCEDMIFHKFPNNNVCLRLVANVGRGASHGVVPAIINKLKSDSECLELFGDYPGSIKPFIHVDDTVDVMISLAKENRHWSWMINVAPKDNITVEDIAEICMSKLNIRKPIKWLGEQTNFSGDNRRVLLRNDYLVGMMKKDYPTSVEAISHALDDYLENN